VANDISARQWFLDTPVSFGDPGAVIWSGNVFVYQIIFQDYGSQGEHAVIKDQHNKIVFKPTGAADGQPIRSNIVGWMNGFVLDELSAGSVQVYIR
jgi:hypothetical protein